MVQYDLFQVPPLVKPKLSDYDYVVIDTSAGKDSQAMTDLVVEQANEEGVRDRLVAVHCDLGRIEWPGTKALAEEQVRHYGLRFEVVKRPQGDLLEQLVNERKKWPDNQNRWCTSDQKTHQVYTLFTRLADEFHGGPTKGPGRAQKDRPCRILDCLGHRREESPKRSKMPQFEHNAKASNKTRRLVDTWRPIHQWTVDQVWDRIRKSGVPHHPAYDLGMPRLSCVFCVFAPRKALIVAGHHNPELLEKYAQAEQTIGHTFRQDQTITEIRDAVAAGERPDMVGIVWPQCA
jgi:3'-phosphoadenosine 5'-phosphosulfate sulfotransferase (PAPS reductase)/FAD synthetase